MDSMDYVCAGESLRLYAEKGLLWVAAETLIITDPHFGKPSAFRHAGIPIPAGTTGDDLERLGDLLDRSGAKRLIILGDFFHHRTGCCEGTMNALANWRVKFAHIDLVLVEGNHDKYSAPIPDDWDFTVVDHFDDGPFAFCHHPCEIRERYVLAGHIHPGVRLADPVGGVVYLPCFHFGEKSAVLPAFGGFTGTAKIRARPGDGVIVVHEKSLYLINTMR